MEQGLFKIYTLIFQSINPDFITVIDFNQKIDWLATNAAILYILLLIHSAINLMFDHFPAMWALDEYCFDGIHKQYACYLIIFRMTSSKIRFFKMN